MPRNAAAISLLSSVASEAVFNMRVLTVCTMNICRSPAMEIKVRELAAEAGVEVEVASGGVYAIPGTPRCEISLAHVGRVEDIGHANLVWDLEPGGFDLILTAQQTHLDDLLMQAPQLSEKSFTLRRASSLAAQAGGLANDPSNFVKQLAELDAATDRPERSKWAPHGPSDIPDPHVLGTNLHEMTAQLIHESVTTLIRG